MTQLETLLNLLKERQLTVEEAQELQALLLAEKQPQAVRLLSGTFDEAWHAESLPAGKAAAMLDAITGLDRTRIRPMRRWMWAAAAALLLLSLGTYLWRQGEIRQMPDNVVADIAPGHTGAVLTLSDGSEVVLDNMANGVVAHQSGSRLVLRNGQLAYAPDGKAQGLAYNVMTTPKGRQFQLTLPDGTKVWLNAASSIRYPTAFAGSERSVEVTGEAYFEVAQNAAMPFKVKVKGRAEIDVLGTQFNVNAYENEASLNTTLLEGSVRVSAGAEKALLKPGQQARVKENIRLVTDIVTDKVVAWKNGLFNFEQSTLPEAMRQLERWYDITVIYENGVPDIRFFGEISRDVGLAELLQMLAGADLKFRLEKGNKLIITK